MTKVVLLYGFSIVHLTQPLASTLDDCMDILCSALRDSAATGATAAA
jgi:hypothetical protein